MTEIRPKSSVMLLTAYFSIQQQQQHPSSEVTEGGLYVPPSQQFTIKMTLNDRAGQENFGFISLFIRFLLFIFIRDQPMHACVYALAFLTPQVT